MAYDGLWLTSGIGHMAYGQWYMAYGFTLMAYGLLPMACGPGFTFSLSFSLS